MGLSGGSPSISPADFLPSAHVAANKQDSSSQNQEVSRIPKDLLRSSRKVYRINKNLYAIVEYNLIKGPNLPS